MSKPEIISGSLGSLTQAMKQRKAGARIAAAPLLKEYGYDWRNNPDVSPADAEILTTYEHRQSWYKTSVYAPCYWGAYTIDYRFLTERVRGLKGYHFTYVGVEGGISVSYNSPPGSWVHGGTFFLQDIHWAFSDVAEFIPVMTWTGAEGLIIDTEEENND